MTVLVPSPTHPLNSKQCRRSSFCFFAPLSSSAYHPPQTPTSPSTSLSIPLSLSLFPCNLHLTIHLFLLLFVLSSIPPSLSHLTFTSPTSSSSPQHLPYDSTCICRRLRPLPRSRPIRIISSFVAEQEEYSFNAEI